jgi:predicted AlkP superfamily pyrophosphatase or phosphodiesterase
VSLLVDDEILALDAEIAALLACLDQRGDSYQLVFTSLHGAPEVPPPAAHIRGEEIAAAVEKALAAQFAKGRSGIRFVEAFIYPFLYLRTARINAADLPRARELAARTAMATGHVASFYTSDGVCSHSGDWEARLRRSFYASRSGDVLLVYRPGLVEASAGDRGVTYGSPYGYDTQVPLFLKGPSFRAARFDHTVEMTALAPTLCAVNGATLPSSATGRVLAEAFAE